MDHASEQYLRNAVMTATPEQLQLMLYDGAVRFTRQGIEGLRARNWEEVFNGFSRAQNIVIELVSSLNYEVDRALCTRMAGIYNFIYRCLVDAHTHRDLAKADEALRQLEYQRETWVLLIERLRQQQPAASSAAPARQAATADESYGSLSLQG
jgi:flagellar protein FliS